jgi:hypothetical protein
MTEQTNHINRWALAQFIVAVALLILTLWQWLH